MNIINDDCYSVIPTLKDKSIDLVLCDPPYDFKGQTKGGGFYAEDCPTAKRHNLKNLEKLDSVKFNPEEFLDMLLPKMKAFNGYFCCNKTLVARYIQWAEKHKFSFDILTMIKENPIPAKNRHHLPDTEYIILIRSSGSYFSSHDNLDDFRKWYMTTCTKRRHPAEKPVEMFERFVRVSSKEGDTILDPFLGSGTTAVACKLNNRHCIGIEKEKKYYDMTLERLND